MAGEEEVDDVVCRRCPHRTTCRRQLRVLHQPNVLFLRVGRGTLGPDSAGVSGHAVVPEKELSFPSSVMAPPFGQTEQGASFELAAVVYHRGPSLKSGHYTARVKAHDGRWYCFDDTDVRHYTGDIERDSLGQVYLLAYSRGRGDARFKDMGELTAPRPAPSAAAAAAELTAVMAAWPSDVWAKRLSLYVKRRQPDFDADRVAARHAETAKDAVCGSDTAALGRLFAELLGDESSRARQVAEGFETYVRRTVAVMRAVGRVGGAAPPPQPAGPALSGQVPGSGVDAAEDIDFDQEVWDEFFDAATADLGLSPMRRRRRRSASPAARQSAADAAPAVGPARTAEPRASSAPGSFLKRRRPHA